MKKTVSRLGSAALCVTLSLALGCGCAVMPPASSEKPASSAVSVPTDAEGKPLYDAARLDDGRLRILYGYDNSGDCRTVLCGSKVLYQSARSENVSLLQDIVTGETNYWFRTWSDSTGRGGRRSASVFIQGISRFCFVVPMSLLVHGAHGAKNMGMRIGRIAVLKMHRQIDNHTLINKLCLAVMPYQVNVILNG